MRQVRWFINGICIESYGNGTSYAVKSPGNTQSAFFQGDDATQWKEDYDAAQRASRLPQFLSDTLRDYARDEE